MRMLWWLPAAALAFFGLGGVIFGVRQGDAFNLVLAALFLLGAFACARKATRSTAARAGRV